MDNRGFVLSRKSLEIFPPKIIMGIFALPKSSYFYKICSFYFKIDLFQMLRFSFFKQPYPYYFKGKNLWKVSFLIFLMSLVFNYLFEPFVVHTPEHRFDYFWISMIHSFNAFMVVFLVLGICNFYVNEDYWTVGKEILLIAVILLIIGISQFLVRDLIYENPNNWSFNYLLEEVRNTFLVGLLFALILVPINYLRLLKSHLNKANSFNNQSQTNLLPSESINIVTRQKSDDFQLNPDDFLFAKAERNYLEIFWEFDGKVIKVLKRMTLKDLETQLESFPHFLKTHRSFLVNLHKVERVIGNAQGYQLDIKGFPNSLPVSRGMIEDFERKFKKG